MLFFKVGNLRLILGEDLFFFLEITMIFRQKVGNLRLILGEDVFFFRDQCDFFGDQSQNGPGLKNVGHS